MGEGERSNHANHLSHMCCGEGTVSALSPRPQSYFEGGLLFKPCCSLIFTGTGEAGGCVWKGKVFVPLLEVPGEETRPPRRLQPRSHQPGSHPALAQAADQTPFSSTNTWKYYKFKVNQLAKSKLSPQHLHIFSPERSTQRESKPGGRCSTTFLLNEPRQTGKGELSEPSPRALRKANRNRSFYTPKNLAFQTFCYSFLPLNHFTLQETLAGRNVSLAVIPCRKK